MWFTSPTIKILRDSTTGKSKDSYTVNLAGNEYEGCQFAIRQQYMKAGVHFNFSEATDKNGNTISYEVFEESFVPVNFSEPFFKDNKYQGLFMEYPDGLIPISGNETYDLNSNQTYPFYILFHSEKDQPAGDYKMKIEVLGGDDNVIDSGDITVHVYNFNLPETSTMQTAMDLSYWQIASKTGLQGDELQTLCDEYYEFMLEHHVSAYNLPYDILDERADKYMDDPRVTGFKVPYSDNDDTIRAYYNKLSQKGEWMEKAYFYPIDEPDTVEKYQNLHAIGERLSRLFPGYRMVVPFFVDPIIDGDQDAIDYASEVMNIWCPKLFCFSNENIYNETLLKTKDSFADRMKAEKEDGDDLWWYVCWEPGDPYSNLYVNMEGVKHRSIFWQAYQYDVNGFLYWSCNYWDSVKNPWEDMNTVKWLTPNVFGDGSLIYNGNAVGVSGACSSLRLEAVRDGIDDYDYIQLALELGISESKIEKIVNKVAKTITDYSDNDQNIYDARAKIAKLIESKNK